MRKILLIGTVLVLPMNAMAQTARRRPSLAEGVPTPRVEGTTTAIVLLRSPRARLWASSSRAS